LDAALWWRFNPRFGDYFLVKEHMNAVRRRPKFDLTLNL